MNRIPFSEHLLQHEVKGKSYEKVFLGIEDRRNKRNKSDREEEKEANQV